MQTNTAGTVKDNYDYFAFGEALNQSVSTDQSYRYTGKPFDDDRALNLFRCAALGYPQQSKPPGGIEPSTY